LGVAAGVAAGLAIVALRTVLPAIFSDDPSVRSLAAFVLWFVAAMQPLNAVVFVLDGLLIGAGDLRFLARAMVVAGSVFVAAAGAVLVADAGIGWLWAGLGLFMTARFIPLLARWRSNRWAVVGAVRA
ncbi:MAG: MATE family efflux transporter, partial [Acidimicrobiales bacterium]